MRTEHEMELAIFTLEAENRELKAERDTLAAQIHDLRLALMVIRNGGQKVLMYEWVGE